METPHIFLHLTAQDFLRATSPFTRQREGYDNTLGPIATSRLPPSSGSNSLNVTDDGARSYIEERLAIESGTPQVLPQKLDPGVEFWMTFWSVPPNAPRHSAKLDFALSCTKGKVGNYPIFLYSQHQPSVLTPDFLDVRVSAFVRFLAQHVDPNRVFSIFGQDLLANAFSAEWSRQTGMARCDEPYYAAKLSFCTSVTLSPTPHIADEFRLRLAEQADEARVAVMFKEFADDSVIFPMSIEDGIKEARALIQARQVWVHEVEREDGTSSIACVVAATRNSENVATITKVYSDPKSGVKGCATRLVHRVCDHFLNVEKKSKVALFVAHDNVGANIVYDRVGFNGLKKGERLEAVEDWTEYGFPAADKGHW